MDQALSILPADYWRWWLLSHAPENSDSEFTWENFQAGVNKDLADVLGNFVSRVTKFCRSKWAEQVPAGGDLDAAMTDRLAAFDATLADYAAHMDAIDIRKASASLRALWAMGNEWLQDAAPWAVYKEDPDRAAAIIRLALNLIRAYGVLSAPFIPDASRAMLAAMKTESRDWPESLAGIAAALPAGHAFTVPDNLFRKIADDERDDWQARFAGTRA